MITGSPGEQYPYLFDDLPDESQEVLERQFAEPLRPPEELRREVEAYLEEVREVALERERVELPLAEQIATTCLQLLDGIGKHTPEDERRLIQVACRYFVMDEDGDSDMGSILGFDDDVAVLNGVLRALDREEWVVHIP